MPRPSVPLLLATALAALAFVYSLSRLPPLPAEYVIEAATLDGLTFHAGSGRDCSSAWDNARLPSDWQRLVCIRLD